MGDEWIEMGVRLGGGAAQSHSRKSDPEPGYDLRSALVFGDIVLQLKCIHIFICINICNV